MTVSITFEPGFGNVKAAILYSNDKRGDDGIGAVTTFPSYLGEGRLRELATDPVGAAKDLLTTPRPTPIIYNGGLEVLVGFNVHHHTSMLATAARFDVPRIWTLEDVTRPFLYSALHKLLPYGKTTCKVLQIMLPIGVEFEADLRQEAENALAKWFVGVQQFTASGRPYEVTIEKIQLLAQPYGAYLNYGLGIRDNGEVIWRDDAVPASKAFLIFDWGMNTLDVATIIDQKAVPRFTNCYEHKGVVVAAERIQAAASRATGSSLPLYEAEALIRQYLRANAVAKIEKADLDELAYLSEDSISLARLQDQQIYQAVRRSIQETSANVITVLDALTGLMHYDQIIFVGGGFEVLREEFQTRYPTAQFAGVKANVMGGIKLLAAKQQREEA